MNLIANMSLISQVGKLRLSQVQFLSILRWRFVGMARIGKCAYGPYLWKGGERSQTGKGRQKQQNW